jgi:septal ring factor EnvC (AmiA/AmiB activator)
MEKEKRRGGMQEIKTPFFRVFLSVYLLVSIFCVKSLYARNPSESKVQEEQIKKLETDLTREKEQFLKFHAKEKTLLEQISDLEQEIVNKKQIIKELKGKIKPQKKELESREKHLQGLKQSLHEVEERLSLRLVAFYKYAKRGYMRLVATSEDFEHLRKGIYYLDIVMQEDKRLLQKLMDLKEEIAQEISGVKDKLAIIANLEKEESHQLVSVRGMLDKKVILLMKIHKEKEFYETAVKELQSAALDLKDTLVDLEQRDEQKRRLGGFQDYKGRLPLPFHGKIFRKHNLLGEKGPGTHKGIFFEGPMDADVRAVFPGVVEFSGWLKGYGQIIIINHGARFFTISAHLSQRHTEKGASVAGGEVIGRLGQTGLIDRPLLYFEMRRAGANLDPLVWLKLH